MFVGAEGGIPPFPAVPPRPDNTLAELLPGGAVFFPTDHVLGGVYSHARDKHVGGSTHGVSSSCAVEASVVERLLLLEVPIEAVRAAED